MQEYISHLLQKWQLPSYLWNLIILAGAIFLGLAINFILSIIASKKRDIPGQLNLSRASFRHLRKPLSYFIPLLVFNLFLPVMQMPELILRRVDHFVEIALISSFAWTLVNLIRVAQDVVNYRVNIHTADNLRQRKLLTQLMYIRRVVTAIIILITIGAVLLTFDTMRKIGTGLLTGVGIGGIIIGFAAQRSLGNLLAGFQIAFTQPIRIDDEVIVEGEFGWIEEITLTYVIVRIWDNRRMVLPINYFIEKPFQNWTRTTSDITGSFFIYSDYTLPVEWLRKELMVLLKDHPLWDQKSAGLQVTDLKKEVVEMRITVTTLSSGNSWDLRCFLREQLIKRINENYPQCLPRVRADIASTLRT